MISPWKVWAVELLTAVGSMSVFVMASTVGAVPHFTSKVSS